MVLMVLNFHKLKIIKTWKTRKDSMSNVIIWSLNSNLVFD